MPSYPNVVIVIHFQLLENLIEITANNMHVEHLTIW